MVTHQALKILRPATLSARRRVLMESGSCSNNRRHLYQSFGWVMSSMICCAVKCVRMNILIWVVKILSASGALSWTCIGRGGGATGTTWSSSRSLHLLLGANKKHPATARARRRVMSNVRTARWRSGNFSRKNLHEFQIYYLPSPFSWALDQQTKFGWVTGNYPDIMSTLQS